MNDQLLIGIVLIGIGILLAVLAYMFLGNRGPQEKQPLILKGQEPRIEQEPSASPVDTITAAESAGGDNLDAPYLPSKTPPDSPAPIPDELPPASKASAAASTPAKGERIQVATLLRDEVSGKLIVQVDDVEYEDREALKDSLHWTRVEYAAKDLSQWIETIKPKPTVKIDREFNPPELKPTSMIEQIDQILQERIRASGRLDLGVRLTEGPGGTARVLIGLNSYEITDVPNSEIQTLIREAVATWEATQ